MAGSFDADEQIGARARAVRSMTRHSGAEVWRPVGLEPKFLTVEERERELARKHAASPPLTFEQTLELYAQREREQGGEGTTSSHQEHKTKR